MIFLIAAMDKNRVIGKGNTLPWHLPADLKRFKQLTLGKPVIMGRKTFESIGKPLPGRKNIVLTQNQSWQHADVQVCHSVSEVLKYAQDFSEVFVIGGEEIYTLFLPYADKIYLTEVDTYVENGDAFFPRLDSKNWALKQTDEQPLDEKNRYSYRFLFYQKLC